MTHRSSIATGPQQHSRSSWHRTRAMQLTCWPDCHKKAIRTLMLSCRWDMLETICLLLHQNFDHMRITHWNHYSQVKLPPIAEPDVASSDIILLPAATHLTKLPDLFFARRLEYCCTFQRRTDAYNGSPTLPPARHRQASSSQPCPWKYTSRSSAACCQLMDLTNPKWLFQTKPDHKPLSSLHKLI